tara:strand:- start:29 stop:712 length:684 start_codon:yes stop_codon:yes gene_type:complete
MLALKQALSIVSTKSLGGGGWNPSDEGSLVAWYQNKVGIVLNGSRVSEWQDSGLNEIDMLQATTSEQPTYNSSTGVLTFDESSVQNLQSQSQISLSGTFTIAFRINITTYNSTILGDNTTANEYIKITSISNLRIKIDGVQTNIAYPDEFGDNYVVITRDGSNVINMFVDGVLQDDQPTLTGTSDIDSIGVRATDINSFDGDLLEVQIYDATNSTLTDNINGRLSNL